MKTETKKNAIIIAWASKTGLKDTGRLERFDGVNWRKQLECVWQGNACIFSRDLREKDRAINHLTSLTEWQHRRVFVLPDTDDVLCVARERIREIAEKSEA